MNGKKKCILFVYVGSPESVSVCYYWVLRKMSYNVYSNSVHLWTSFWLVISN